MAFSNPTPNYNLPNWEANDIPSYLTDFNGAFTTIDTTMHANSETATQAFALANKAVTDTVEIGTKATNAQTVANEANTLASVAKTAADEARSVADSASVTAGSANQKADNAINQLSSLEELVESAQDDITVLESSTYEKRGSVVFISDNWTASTADGAFDYQIASGVDTMMKYDCNPTVEELKYIVDNGISIVIGNYNGTVRVTAFGEETAVKGMTSLGYSFVLTK